mmetsp:Transcript_51917/g.167123  ORF Transcript_51917/g.167123 Transcript_51917/m.167123 type:complete len:92 (+) Transcript_51917:835-1110(+)
MESPFECPQTQAAFSASPGHREQTLRLLLRLPYQRRGAAGNTAKCNAATPPFPWFADGGSRAAAADRKHGASALKMKDRPGLTTSEANFEQ